MSDQLMRRVDCFLDLLRGCRSGDLEVYIAALEEQVKYYFGHDLCIYTRLIPVHLAQMQELKIQSLETRKALQDGDCSVKKKNILFTNLMVGQALEQIWCLKVAGVVTGIAQNEAILNRFMLIAPELTRIVSVP